MVELFYNLKLRQASNYDLKLRRHKIKIEKFDRIKNQHFRMPRT